MQLILNKRLLGLASERMTDRMIYVSERFDRLDVNSTSILSDRQNTYIHKCITAII